MVGLAPTPSMGEPFRLRDGRALVNGKRAGRNHGSHAHLDGETTDAVVHAGRGILAGSGEADGSPDESVISFGDSLKSGQSHEDISFRNKGRLGKTLF